jgi:hypothetical protein
MARDRRDMGQARGQITRIRKFLSTGDRKYLQA